MAAVVFPARQPQPVGGARPARRSPPVERRHLRLVPAPRRRPAAVYRRRRAVALVVTLVLVAALAVAAWAGARALAGALGGVPLHAPGSPAPAPGAAVHVVQPGDTLWSIARSMQPTGDVRALVDRLVATNGGASVHVGDRILVPG